MKLGQYIRKTRKETYKSVREFIAATKIDIPRASYYAIENGMYTPCMKDLSKIIKLLELDIKTTVMLWLHEHLPEEFKSIFPTPDPDLDNTDRRTFEIDPDEVMVINRTHRDYLTGHRLARLLLIYFYVNSRDKPTLTEINGIFSKHSHERIKKELKYLVTNGYLRLKNSRYQSMTNQLYFPKTEEMAPLINELISDQIRTGNFTGDLQSKYGLYPKGYREFGFRTMTPEHVKYIKNIMQQTFKDIRTIPKTAGQEYFYFFSLAPIDESKH